MWYPDKMLYKNAILFVLSSISVFSNLSAAARIDKLSYNEPLRETGQIPPDLTIENLQLGDTASRRGRTTLSPLGAAATTTTTSRPIIVDDSDVVLYRLNNKDGRACILILTDAIVQFNFITNINTKEEGSLFIPSKYEATGNCESGDDAYITISWRKCSWTVKFSKTPGGDHWYVEKMELDVDTDDPHLQHINHPKTILHFESVEKGMTFPTPVGKSYACEDEQSAVLKAGDVTATILLRKLKMQPFIFKKDDFGPEHVCLPGGGKSYRSETAPVAVGSTLAVVSILTVAGYGVYRYMKVKKVQYDTME